VQPARRRLCRTAPPSVATCCTWTTFIMDLDKHTMHELFRQLGLPSEEADVRRFIAAHRPIPDAVRLADASFWTPAQAQFLCDEFIEDADWAEVVDQLNLALRA
jgi:hypothetical protein